MNLDKLVRIAAISIACSGAFLGGCSVDAAPETAPEGTVEQQSEALSGGRPGGLGYSCQPIGCTCTGDTDCNNMFGDGACGSWPAKCYERGPSNYCICAPWVRNTAAAATQAGSGGTAVFSSSP